MERRGVSLAEIQEVPKSSLILLAGPPGVGKSTFCHQVVLNGLAMDKPVIFVTTEQGPAFWTDPDSGDEILVGITSWGDMPCVATGISYRVDIPDTLDFMDEVISGL